MNASAGLVAFNTPLADGDHGGKRRASCAASMGEYDFEQRHSSNVLFRGRSGSQCQLSGYLRVDGKSPADMPGSTARVSDRTKIRINVRGKKYETFLSTLEQFPDTLLGSDGGRERFYDALNEELCFNRDRNSFDAILFFYQSGGILARPATVNEELFNEEVKFFHLFEESEEQLRTESSCSLFNDLAPIPTNRREKLWNILERPPDTCCGRIFARVSWLVILLSVIAFCLETEQSLKNVSAVQDERSNKKQSLQNLSLSSNTNGSTGAPRPTPTAPSLGIVDEVTFWFYIDTIFVIFFTAEYIARVYSAPNRLQFIRSFLAIVDFCAITPYYILHIANAGKLNSIKSFSVIRSIRLFRVIRLLKLSRYSSGLKLLGRALLMSRGKMMSLLCCVVMAVVFYSGLLYYIEGYQENEIFTSIPDAFWFSIVTMSTVGYGDVVPQTPPGKLVGAFCALTGIILLYILPIPAFVTDFSKLYEKWLRAKGRTRTEKRSQIKFSW